jgi:hypothetical protein
MNVCDGVDDTRTLCIWMFKSILPKTSSAIERLNTMVGHEAMAVYAMGATGGGILANTFDR